MQRIARLSVCLALAALICSPGLAPAEEPAADAKEQAEQSAPLIQLAILLDTSGSMSGLINQARTQLWKIVNDLATSKQDGKVPNLQVALYEYGKSSLPKSEGYLRQIVPLSDDLDRLSGELFALTTNGGQEYCGQVISEATSGLQWSKSEDTLKLIFIAGNEPFTQGEVNYKDACKAAIEKGITVNTIYCGPEAAGVSTGWQDGAKLADGSFTNIDQNRQVAQIKTPYDAKLAELGAKVNTTYLFFGRAVDRRKAAQSQVAADEKANAAAPAAAAERAAFKGKAQYRAANDLLDGLKSGKVKLEELEAEELPKELQGKSVEEQKVIVKKLEKERAEIQEEITKLSKLRNEHIAKEREKQAEADGEKSLDVAILKAIREQAGKKRFEFEK